jgi:hypothetical protein
MAEPSELMEPKVVPDPVPKAASLLRDDVELVRQQIASAASALNEARRGVIDLGERYNAFSAEDRQRFGVGHLPRPGVLKELAADVEDALVGGEQ